MPNYIRNKLTVTGNPDSVETVFSHLCRTYTANDKKRPVSFFNIVVPAYPDSYDCRLDTWGVRGDCYYHDEENLINDKRKPTDPVYFLTSWSPPIKAIEALSTLFTDVNITLDYSIEGMIFSRPDGESPVGRVVYRNGELIGQYQPVDRHHLIEQYFVCYPDRVSDYKLFLYKEDSILLVIDEDEKEEYTDLYGLDQHVLQTPEDYFKRSFG